MTLISLKSSVFIRQWPISADTSASREVNLYQDVKQPDRSLTSVDESVDILNLSNGGMVAVRDERLHGVQQTVHIDDGSVVLDPQLQLLQPLLPVLVLGNIPLASLTHDGAGC